MAQVWNFALPGLTDAAVTNTNHNLRGEHFGDTNRLLLFWFSLEWVGFGQFAYGSQSA